MLHRPTKVRAYMHRLPLIGEMPSHVFEASEIHLDAIEQLLPMRDDLVAELFHQLARHTPDGFAFECGKRAKLRDLGMIGFRLLFCPTLQSVFDNWVRFSLIAHPPLATNFRVAGDRWYFEQWPRLPLSANAARFCIEAAVTSFIKLIDDMLDYPIRLFSLSVPFSDGGQRARYEMLGFEEVRFDADMLRFEGSISDLARPMSVSEFEADEVSERECADAVSRLLNATSLAQRTEILLRPNGKIPSLEDAASTLGLSARSLHRELASEGESYGSVLQRFRKRSAIEMLDRTDLEIKQIAWRLGYGTVDSFRRAFSDWTTVTPNEWRRRTTKARA